MGIDFSDALEIIRKLVVDDYQYTQMDSKNKYELMHIFFKKINDKDAYIKIGFKNDKTVVISFHEKLYEE